jgi:hypothetical protein
MQPEIAIKQSLPAPELLPVMGSGKERGMNATSGLEDQWPHLKSSTII